MPWELRIKHIDITRSGDATLFIARNRNAAGVVTQTRSMLVDGGHLFNWRDLDHVIATDEGLAALDTIVVTHYDADHFGGIRGLLQRPDARYANCRIYDQGVPVAMYTTRNRDNTHNARYRQGYETDYRRYINAIGRAGTNRTRVTQHVCSLHPTDTGLDELNYHNPWYLLGREILWDGVAGGVPANAPTATVVAVNSYVSQVGGGRQFLSSGTLATENLKNERSIALLIQFGNFKYYVGGDLENAQEDDGAHGLKLFLNQTNDAAGRVHAFKTSHHGSRHSTAATFLNRIRGRAAIISCARNNQYGHPDDATINRLNANASVNRYYLTGDQQGRGFMNAKARVCGSFREYGDVTINLNFAEANNDPTQFHINYGRPAAGNNPYDGTPFAERPYHNRVQHF